MQIKLQSGIKRRNPIAFYGVSLIAQLIKIDHAIDLIETQGVKPLNDFFKKLGKEETKASKNLFNIEEFNNTVIRTESLVKGEVQHPKSKKLLELIQNELTNDPNVRIIVFANFRATVAEIIKLLEENKIKCRRFVGQANRGDKGLSQKAQAKIIQEFRDPLFNVLVASSVGEEGIDIIEVKAVIFYEAVPSELRRIQRAGRTARTKPGKVIFLLTKDSRDEAYYWSAYNKEKKMKRTLYKLKNKMERQVKLN